MIDEQKLKNILKEVRKPGRYTGGEWNEVKKDFRSVKVKIALVFPDVYEIGMSHLGQKILYSILNDDPDILAERVYTPGLDFEEKIGKQDLPLFSLENKIPLSKFDILGFSLLYELNYSNILTVLDLGNIPLNSSKRFNMTPLIIAGGPAVFNPEPVSEIFDLFLVGDGEEAFLEIIKEFEHLKKETNDKQEVLKELSRIKGVYIPCFYKSFFPNNSLLQAVKPVNDAPEKIKKRIISPFNQSYFPEKILVPNIRTIFDRVSLEVARGCPQKCRFCQASSLYFPYRARNPSFIVRNALSNLKNTGYEDLSLTSLSISDYPILDTIVEELMRRLNKKKISLSLSSLRPKGLSSSIAENIIKVRKTGFTVVPEAGTERLRGVINKNLSDEELFNAVTNAFSKGWRLIKLYFMVGLPTEKEEDLHGMIDLIKDIIKYGYKYLKKSPKINLSIASFIPKAHTPFQWLAMEDEDALIEKQRYIKSELKKYPFVRIKWHPVKNSLLEAIFSRGDRRLSKVLFRAWKMGARFDSWSDCFDMDIWEKSFEQENIDYKIYLSSLDTKSVLPWEHIDTGIKKSHLIKELNKALKEKYTSSCIDNDCQSCGGCSLGHMIEYDVSNQINVPEEKTEYFGEKKKEWIIYRATYLKCHQSRYLSHVELSNAIQRSFR
ncbi:MAG: TIGR03960 family B12-binding radical SAM protein, partial [Candidatus Aminicenantaceae bacterium]